MLLRLLSCLIGYRFHDYLSPMILPYEQKGLDAKEVRDKSRASTAVAGIFVAFVVGLLAAFATIAAEHPEEVLGKLLPCTLLHVLGIAAGTGLPYLILWSERKISAAHAEAKALYREVANPPNPACSSGVPNPCDEGTGKDKQKEEQIRDEKEKRQDVYGTVQTCLILLSVGFLIACTSREILLHALAPAGLILAFTSLLLLVLSVEFYDTAGGWMGFNDIAYHFHMASLASHCYLMGLSLTLLGSSLLLCLVFPILGCVVTAIVLAVLLAMTKIERRLFDLRSESARTSGSLPTLQR